MKCKCGADTLYAVYEVIDGIGRRDVPKCQDCMTDNERNLPEKTWTRPKNWTDEEQANKYDNEQEEE